MTVIKQFEPDEVLAGILLVGCLFLVGLGIDGEVKSILSMSAAWLFGREYGKIKSKGDKNGGRNSGTDSSGH